MSFSKQTTQYACVAGRFFEGMINFGFLKKIKKKLEEFAGVCREELKSFESNNASENSSVNPVLMIELLSDRAKSVILTHER
jgi:hypothetical protein